MPRVIAGRDRRPAAGGEGDTTRESRDRVAPRFPRGPSRCSPPAVADARARFDKSDAAERREVVTRHPSFAVKRLPTTRRRR